MIKRTEGVSTTDIVGRMLLMNKEHHMKTPRARGEAGVPEGSDSAPGSPIMPGLGVRAGPSGSMGSLREIDEDEDEEDSHNSSGICDSGLGAAVGLGVGEGEHGRGGGGPGDVAGTESEAEAEAAGRERGKGGIGDESGGEETHDPVDFMEPWGSEIGPPGIGIKGASSSGSGSVTSQMRRIAAQQGPTRFLPTSRRFTQFSTGKAPAPGDRVVYVPGGWDLFNTGHIETLKQCKALGDFVIVGVYDDQTVNRLRGGGWPVLNQYERTMSVLACRYADEVVMDAPFHVTRDLLTNFDVATVVQPSRSDLLPVPTPGEEEEEEEEDDDA